MRKLAEWIVVIAALAALWACGSPEQATVDQFFRAAQTNDHTTIALMSAVGAPLEVESWKVVEVSSRSTEPYTLPELLERFEVAEQERDTAAEERKKYFDEHQYELEEIIPKQREDSEYKFRGKLGEIQEAWSQMLEERNEKEHAYQELKRQVDEETSLARRSVMSQLDIGTLKGDIAVTEMLVSLKSPDRDELPFRVTLRKYDVSGPESERLELARWIIEDIEGATPEAQAAASERAEPRERVSEPPAVTEPPQVAASQAAPEREQPARTERESGYRPQELRGLAKVQFLTPVTKVEGDEVVSTIQARNVSRDWITRFTVTEHWYDERGTAVRSTSRTHDKRFMPGEIIELELRTRSNPSFYQNQFEFSHANGEVDATVVSSFPT